MKRHDTPTQVSLEPTIAARSTVIWMHGLGADGNDFAGIVPMLRLPADLGVRFIFPHAPVQPVTLNGGQPMRSWFDILSLDRRGLQDAVGIRKSEQRIHALIDDQVAAGIPASRIVLAGFSQGGAVTLQTGLRHPQALAGLLVLSSYLPLEATVAAEAAPANREVPILMQHGLYDPVLPYALGSASRDALVALGYKPVWDEYPMQHEVCEEQIDDIAAFLRQQLA